MTAEIKKVLRDLARKLRASMRPRSNDRGNHLQRPLHQGDCQASMRPRSNDRGNASYVDLAASGGIASMRPRSNDRGNSLYRNQLIFNNLPRQMRAATSQTPESESFTDPSYV